MSKSNAIYRSLVEVTADYLGPAADRFIDRQIQSHLNKKPDEITRKDIVALISWSKIAMALLTSDDAVVDEFTDRLTALSN